MDTAYDPTAFHIDFNPPYFLAPINQQAPQQPNQSRYLVSQPRPPPQQPSTNVQTSSSSPSTSTTSTPVPKKGPAMPPGILLPTTQPTYGISPSINGQQYTGPTTFSTSYDVEHLFRNSFMQLTNAQQAQSPPGTYGSVTSPIQQQTQTHNNNDNKTIKYEF